MYTGTETPVEWEGPNVVFTGRFETFRDLSRTRPSRAAGDTAAHGHVGTFALDVRAKWVIGTFSAAAATAWK